MSTHCYPKSSTGRYKSGSRPARYLTNFFLLCTVHCKVGHYFGTSISQVFDDKFHNLCSLLNGTVHEAIRDLGALGVSVFF